MTSKKDIIYNCGKEIFEKKGFKDTGIAEIMKRADMATGTFYNYYTSKDALFIEIYNNENAKLKSRIVASLNMEDSPSAVVQDMMIKNHQGMMEHPILREWYNRDIFQKIEQNFREGNALAHVSFLYDSFIEIIRKWQAEEKMRSDISAEMIMAIFAALVNVETHKEEIGLEYFPSVIDYLAEFTLKGLTMYESQEA